MTVFRSAVIAALLAAPVFSGVVIRGQDAPTYQERDFLTRGAPDSPSKASAPAKATGRRTARVWSFRASASRAIPSIRSTCSIWRAATPSASRPGIGKTTCAFFRPGTDEIEFASTHADPKSKQYQDDELAFRASGKERRYSWDYDPEMDIYSYSEKTGRA